MISTLLAASALCFEELSPEGERFSAPVMGGKFLAANYQYSSLDPTLKGQDCVELPVHLPDEFQVTERVFSLLPGFDLSTQGVTIASASRTILALTPTYDLEDDASNVLARASTRFFAWGTTADVVDALGKAIGRIEENLWRIFPWAEYRLFDAEERFIAIATMNFFGTEFQLADPNVPDRVYAIISRPFCRCFRDVWTVQVVDKNLDPRMLAMLAIYQTDKDNRARFIASYQ